MTTPVRIGFVGCGSVMREPYMSIANQLQLKGLAEVRVACDINPALEPLVRRELRIPAFTTDYRAVIESDEVDLVVVLTSMLEHGPIAKAALQAGKHVLVEKPMATTLAEAAELVELARRGSQLLLPAPHVILSPTYQTIWRRIHQGEIGKVLTARALYGHSGPDWGPWYYRAGGGPLFDLAVYNVTSLTGLLGPVKRVTAMTGAALPERIVEGQTVAVGVEDNAHVLLDWGDSVFGVVTTGFTIQSYRCPTIEIYGSKGTIQLLGDDWDPNGYELWQNEVGAWQVWGETHPNWPWTDGLRHLVECIVQGTTPIITPEHAFHVLEIMLKAGEAGRSGRTQLIESSFTPPRFDHPDRLTDARHFHDRTRTTL